MSISLNFSGEVKEAKKFLSSFENLGTATEYEALRVRIGSSGVTLYNSGKVVIQGRDEENVKHLVLEALKNDEEHIIGIDETGRGERTGPFVVCAVLGNKDELRELRDSKKARKLDEKYRLATALSLANVTVSLNSEEVDRARERGLTLNGIEAKIIANIGRIFADLGENAVIRIDGQPLNSSMKGVEFVVKGDDKVPVIGAASVIAKKTRDISGDKNSRKTWRTKEK